MSVSVSETIGKLLLEGYKMLADSCDICGSVLMQDRRGRIICVQCESNSMANSVQPEVRSSGKLTNGSKNESPDEKLAVTTLVTQNPTTGGGGTLSSCEDMINNEIRTATTALKNLSQDHTDLQTRLMYVRYIRECAETIKAVKEAKL